MVPMDDEFFSEGKNDAGQDVSDFEAPDIGPEEFAEHMSSLIANALSHTKMFEVVETAHGIGQVHVLGRVKRKYERKFLDEVVEPILRIMENSETCNGFIGKQFLLKEDVVKYAWVISYASNDLRESTYTICRSFEAAIPRREVTESPLMGPGTPTGKVGASHDQAGVRGATPVQG